VDIVDLKPSAYMIIGWLGQFQLTVALLCSYRHKIFPIIHGCKQDMPYICIVFMQLQYM